MAALDALLLLSDLDDFDGLAAPGEAESEPEPEKLQELSSSSMADAGANGDGPRRTGLGNCAGGAVQNIMHQPGHFPL